MISRIKTSKHGDKNSVDGPAKSPLENGKFIPSIGFKPSQIGAGFHRFHPSWWRM